MARPIGQNEGKADNLCTNEKKWSKPLMGAGRNVIPNIMIEKQEALSLDALDMNIILHLSHYWWQPDNVPRPSVATNAKAIGVVPRDIQKRIKAFEAFGDTEFTDFDPFKAVYADLSAKLAPQAFELGFLPR